MLELFIDDDIENDIEVSLINTEEAGFEVQEIVSANTVIGEEQEGFEVAVQDIRSTENVIVVRPKAGSIVDLHYGRKM